MAEKQSGIMASVNIVLALVLITVVGGVGLFISDTVYDTSASTVTSAAVASRGTLTLTGNTTCGELVNVTNVAGSKAVFVFNQTGAGCAAVLGAYDDVVVPNMGNTSTISATNLTTAINNNATINATMTATNPSAGVVLITYTTAGTVGNTVATVETLTNGAWDAATLTGGLAITALGAMQNNIYGSGQTGSSFIVILVIAFIGSIAMGYLFGMMGKKRN